MLTYIIILLIFGLVFLVAYLAIKVSYKLRNLEHQNMLMDSLIDATDEGFYIWDSEKRIEKFSPNLLALFNTVFYSFDEFADFFEESDLLKRNLSEAKEMSKSFTIKLKAKDIEIYCLCYGKSIIGSANSVIGALLWIKNISYYIMQINNLKMENTRYKQELKDLVNILNIIPYPIWKREHNSKIKIHNTSYSKCVKSSKKLQLGSGILKNNTQLKCHSETRYVIIDNERKLYNLTEVSLDGSNEFIGYAEDVTQIEQLHNKLDSYVTAQKILLENLSVAIALYDKNQKLQFYNNAFAKLLNFNSLLLTSNPTYYEVISNLFELKELLEHKDYEVLYKQKFEFFTTLLDPYNYLLHLKDGRVLSVLVIPYALEGILFLYEDITSKAD